MIIPMVCFTCGCPISHQWMDYLRLVKTDEGEADINAQSGNFIYYYIILESAKIKIKNSL